MGKYTRLGKNAALIFAGSAGSKLLSLLMLPFYTRWLSVDDYGTVDLITTYSWLLLGVVSCGICDSIFIFPKDKPADEQTRYLSSGIVFWLAASAAAGLLAAVYFCFCSPEGIFSFTHSHLWAVYAVMITSFAQSFIQQFLRAIDRMAVYSLTGVVMSVATVVCALCFVPRHGVDGFINSLVLSNVIAIVYSVVAGGLWRFVKLSAVAVEPLKQMLKYSIPLIPNGIMWFLIASLNRPVLENYCGLWAVGVFAVASKFPNLLNTLYQLFQNAWLISVLEEARKPTYSGFYNNMLKLVVAVQSLAAVALALAGKFVIRLFTTEDFYSAWQYIPLLVVGVIFMNIATFAGSNFAVTRQSRYYLYSTALSGLSSVILNFSLIPVWGLWGACWAMLISQLIGMAVRIKLTWSMVQITDLRFYVGNLLFLAGGIVASLILDGNPWIVLAGILLAPVYFLVNRNEILKIKDLIKMRYGSFISNI